jgi:PAS domain S-box-containing protein
MSDDDQRRVSNDRIQLLSQILDALPQVVWVKDAQLRFVFANQAFAKEFSIPVESVIGKRDEDFYDNALSERYRRNDQEALSEGKATTTEELFNLQDGTQRVLLTHKIPLRSESIGFSGVLGMHEEITDLASLKQLREKENLLREAERQLQKLSRADEKIQRSPKAFISYKHTDPAHELWVRKFTTDLIEVHGIECLLDQFDLDFGDSIQHYMQRIQTDATHVLLVITPESVQAIQKNSGGIAFETQLAAALRDKHEIRLIPVLRHGTETPAYVRSHLYIDFRDKDLYQDMLKRLADSILGRKSKPVIGSRPLRSTRPSRTRSQAPTWGTRSAPLSRRPSRIRKIPPR